MQAELNRLITLNVSAQRIAENRISRLERMAKALDGRAVTCNARERFVSGIGVMNALQNGLHLDWTSGWPAVPGAGIKGATRHWVENWATLEELGVDNDDLYVTEDNLAVVYELVFGLGPENDDPGCAGAIVFHDGWFGPETRLILEIMTPHYVEWQTSGAAPGDWGEPRPLPFIAVEKGARMTTAVTPGTKESVDVVDIAIHWISSALSETGLGAKTAEGHGRFTVQ